MNELLRLRGEVGVLRRQTNEFGKLREENQQLHTGQDVTKEQMARLLNEAQNYVKLHQIDAHNALKIIGLATRRYADDHGGRYPTNFDQIIDDLDGSTNFGSNIRLDDFEFVNAGLPSERYPQMIIFRQRFPVRTENGKWSRVYGTVDGSVLTETSADGNFDDFERQHVVLPPNQ